MPPTDHDLFVFQAYRTFTGDVVTVGGVRRNGTLALSCLSHDPPPRTARCTAFAPLRAAFAHLTAIERRTWRRILEGRSISDIAREDSVSHAAIYARIRGRGHPTGGMVAKNPWVALWWARRSQRL